MPSPEHQKDLHSLQESKQTFDELYQRASKDPHALNEAERLGEVYWTHKSRQVY